MFSNTWVFPQDAAALTLFQILKAGQKYPTAMRLFREIFYSSCLATAHESIISGFTLVMIRLFMQAPARPVSLSAICRIIMTAAFLSPAESISF